MLKLVLVKRIFLIFRFKLIGCLKVFKEKIIKDARFLQVSYLLRLVRIFISSINIKVGLSLSYEQSGQD